MAGKISVEYNRHFFDEVTPTTAYWAGVLAGDGYLQEKPREVVELAQSGDNMHVVDEFAGALGYTNGLVPRQRLRCFPNAAPQKRLQLHGGRALLDGLRENFALCGKKAERVAIPVFTEQALELSYLVGLIDADGYVGVFGRRKLFTVALSSNRVNCEFFKLMADKYAPSRNVRPALVGRNSRNERGYRFSVDSGRARILYRFLKLAPCPHLTNKWRFEPW